MKHKTKLLYVLLLMITGLNLSAQDWHTEKRINVLFGLSQPLVAHGFNVELNYIHDRFIFDFSQGVGLRSVVIHCLLPCRNRTLKCICPGPRVLASGTGLRTGST